MERLKQAHFWLENARQLRRLAQDEPVSEMSLPTKLRDLASEYDRLADTLVANWARTRNIGSAIQYQG
jgi:hypothetical protein